MKTTIRAAELSSLVKRLNHEIQDQIINTFGASPGLDHVISWSMVGDDERLEILGITKMVEIRSVVIPANLVDNVHYSISLSGARLEVVGGWRLVDTEPWRLNLAFGDAGSLIQVLPSYEPDCIKSAAVALAEAISKYLDAELETC